ncbi:MAG: hypothetical protein UY47_C0003G0039 [Parcubacteria group bacterium GW2011_GWB1_49_7]|nr:MAG: hypothetical protein UX28_C0004G0021 [Candidatus Pacebacteria bacterium GW2011_GWA1_46_10]KKW09951.1 MAG: hypothetical protein UY47_C0003G0039 [Parcubacteria group bacterium GW2011_GWB1_49_7]HCR81004.1 hypothetical protein [Candidatus Paceibacterota bacterium]
MKIISMKQLRQKFDPIRKGLERGETYLLMYRSKPLGVMRPYSPATDAQHLGAGDETPTLAAAPKLQGLPNPKTISFGSTFSPTLPTEKTPTSPATAPTPAATPFTRQPDAQPTEHPTKPLDRLGMRKAFI